jgi:hypothetical protein
MLYAYKLYNTDGSEAREGPPTGSGEPRGDA